MQDLKEIFPILTDPTWLEKREQAWELLLIKGDFKKDYRKKELEKVRKYFFEGVMLDDSPLKTYTGMWVQMFPLQTSEGYDFFYTHYKYSKEDLEDFNTQIFHGCDIYGMLPEDELAYWDYHVGREYTPSVERKTPDGVVELNVDAERYFGQLFVSTFNLLWLSFDDYSKKFIDRLDYTFSILKYLVESGVEPDEDSVDLFERKMFSAITHTFGKHLKDVTDFHHRFCDDMVKYVDECDCLPPKFAEVWAELKKEYGSR